MRLTLVRLTDPATATRGPAVARVNLLPEAARVRLVTRRRTRCWCAAAGMAALLTFVGWRVSSHTSTELEAAQRQLAAVQAQIRNESRRAAALAARIRIARERRALLAGVCTAQTWAPHLAQVALAVPPDAYLTRITIDATRTAAPPPSTRASATREAPAPATPPASPLPVHELHIDGVAADHAAVTTFVANLQQAGCFQSIELARSTASGSGPARVLEFAIVCRR
jgi:Tfp pilus assembly protein PilN